MSNSNSQLEQAIIDYRIKCDMAVSELKDGFYTQEDYEKAIKWELDRLLALIHSREQEIVQKCIEEIEVAKRMAWSDEDGDHLETKIFDTNMKAFFNSLKQVEL